MLRRLYTRWNRVTIRVRVAALGSLIALVAAAALAAMHMLTLSSTSTDLAASTSMSSTRQLARATHGVGSSLVAQAIPYQQDGLDGFVMFDAQGRVTASGGSLAPLLRRHAVAAREVSDHGQPRQWFQLPRPDAESHDRLAPWSSDETVLVTFLPQAEGAVASGYHVGWATERLRGGAERLLISVAGVTLLLGCGLTLMLGWLVSRPIGRLAGEVRALDHGGGGLSPQASPELSQLADDIAEMHDELSEALQRASTDPLTGISNHRVFHDRLTAAVEAAGPEQPVSLLAVDLDDFKSTNDHLGHAAGDRMLVEVAEALRRAAGDTGVCARLGGDEFAVLLPGRSGEHAMLVAQRVLREVEGIRVRGPAGSDVSVQLSIGACELPADAATKEELVHRADVALYRAKARGRGRAHRYHEPLESPPATAAQWTGAEA